MSVTGFIDRSPLLASLNYAKGQVLHRYGHRRHLSGSTAFNLGVDKAVDYVEQVVQDYIRYGASSDPARLENKSILEIGPGDNLGVALLFLSFGARSVTCLDGFAPQSDPGVNSHIYARLYERMSPLQRDRVADVFARKQDGSVTLRPGRLRPYYRARIEYEHEALPADSYDIVVSRAVLEHVGNLEAAWGSMVRCLQPGGEMWHKVDLRCHRLYESIHPLYFLTFNERLWRLVSRPDPTLNRARLPIYRDLLSRTFESSKLYYTRVVGGPEIEPHTEDLIRELHYGEGHLACLREIRSKLKRPFREYTDEELLVTGIFLSAQKKAGHRTHAIERLATGFH